MNPAAADIPSAFLRSFVRNLTSKSKKKNCLDDAAIHLFDFEELMRSLPEKPPDAQHSAEMVQEADVEEEEEEELDLQAGAPSEDRVTQWLSSTASSKAAAPIVSKFRVKLGCAALLIRRLPEVKRFQLCNQHNGVEKAALLRDLGVAALEDFLRQKVKKITEAKKSGEEKRSTKLQRVSHL